jgi:hypothetical protein
LSPYSNVGRVLSPISDIINSNIEYASNLINTRYRQSGLDTYSKLYTIPSYGEYKKVESESTRIISANGNVEYIGTSVLENIGQYGEEFFGLYPATGVELLEDPSNWLEDSFSVSLEPGETHLNLRFVSPNRAYITSAGGAENIPVIISGYTKDYKYVAESITITHKGCFESFNEFSEICSVQTPIKIDISNYVDCQDEHSIVTKETLPSRVTDLDGSFLDAGLTFDEETVFIVDKARELESPIGQYDMEIPARFGFLSSIMDVYTIDEAGWLGVAKPTFNLSSDTIADGSANNNEYVYLEDYEHRVGSVIRARVKAHQIAARSSSNNIRISVKNGETLYYVDRFGNLMVDENTWIDARMTADIINIAIMCDNKDPYLFKVEDEDGNTYSTMLAQMVSQYTDIIDGCTAMYLYNKELYVVRKGSLYKVRPLRHIYSRYNSSRIALDSDYGKIKVS